MQVAIDLRSLHAKNYSGVEHFAVQAIEQLINSDKSQQYLLYYNGAKPKSFNQFHFVNVKYKQTRIPNRLLNFCFKFFNWPKIEILADESTVLLMPNPNMVALRSTTKLVLVIHDLSPILMPEMYSIKAQIWHKMINVPKLCRRADKILAVSEYTKQALVNELGIEASKIHTGLLGVDHERYHPDLDILTLRSVRNRYGLPGKFILFIGTLEPRKNLARLLEAFELLPNDCHLVIGGKLGWRYSEAMSLINNSKKKNFIHYLGYIPEDDKPAIIKLAKVFAWPSLYEGFGLPVLEAMAVGVPVLTSNVTSLPEVAGDSALMVNPYNIEDVKIGLETLLNQNIVRDRYIKSGLIRAKKFTWDHTAQILKQLLH